jgi:predicted dehydrogenase
MGAVAPVRLGIIGTGLAIELLHWPPLSKLPDRFQIAAFSNHTRPKAEAFAQLAGLSMAGYSADYADLLRRDDVDAVLIALPIPLLYPATRKALEAGKHVLVEKPAGADLEQGRAFVALAAQYPTLKVLVAENFYYRDDLLLARSMIQQGRIGQVHLMHWRIVNRSDPSQGGYAATRWRQNTEYRGGFHLDGGVHHVAQMRLLLGEVQAVHAFMADANPIMGGQSDMVLNLRFASGAIGSYTAAYLPIAAHEEPNEMRIYGSGGSMALRGRRVRVVGADGEVEDIAADNDGGYYNQLVNFHQAIVEDQPIAGTIAQSFANLQVIMRALDSVESGQVVQVEGGEVPA